jgi:hypothetical protein
MILTLVTVGVLALGACAPDPFPPTVVSTSDGEIRIATPQFQATAKQFTIRDGGKFWDFKGTEEEPVRLVTRTDGQPGAKHWTGTRITYSTSDGSLVVETKDSVIELVNRKK